MLAPPLATPASSRALESAVGIMFSEPNERFVADGAFSWWKSAEGEKVRQQIEAEVGARYRAELERAGWLRQILLQHRMRREIAAERARVTLETLWTRQ